MSHIQSYCECYHIVIPTMYFIYDIEVLSYNGTVHTNEFILLGTCKYEEGTQYPSQKLLPQLVENKLESKINNAPVFLHQEDPSTFVQ